MHEESVVRAILTAREGRGPAAHGATVIPLSDGLRQRCLAGDCRDGDRAVLRIDRGLVSVTYPMEHALMARLEAVGAAVPHPIVGSWEVPDWTGPAFSLTSGPGQCQRCPVHSCQRCAVTSEPKIPQRMEESRAAAVRTSA